MDTINQTYWDNRWTTQDTGWDMGHASPPLVHFVQTINDKNLAILIPGCGNAHEAEYLLRHGFTNVTLLDISPKLVNGLMKRFFSLIGRGLRVICDDFFDHEGSYDLILEQTFFCALQPSLREKYVKKMCSLLKPEGLLAGLLFNKEMLDGPPFGGNEAEYRTRFEPFFLIEKMQPAIDSIDKRLGNELFFMARKKDFVGN